MRRICISVITCGLLISGPASAGLSKQDRDELFQRIDDMCRDASPVGEVFTYDGSLDANATLKVAGVDAKGKVNKEQWRNIEQKYGETRTNPTICKFEMLKLIVPLFEQPKNLPDQPAFPPKVCGNRAESIEVKTKYYSGPHVEFQVVPFDSDFGCVIKHIDYNVVAYHQFRDLKIEIKSSGKKAKATFLLDAQPDQGFTKIDFVVYQKAVD